MRLLLLLLCLPAAFLHGQVPHSHLSGRPVIFPDIPGYLTLKCDLHQHTVFSDGSVWPDIRVQEALMDGLDAISLTEHIEYQPHKDDIPHPDRNRSFQLALKEAKSHNLVIINGSEITRRMPPGHCNAIFLSDANKLIVKDSVEVFREAKKQGAFVFWNHPNWVSQRRDGMATLTDMHRYLIREKLLDGIEVVNDHTFSDEALQIALDNNLTILGNSDIHKLIDWDFKVPEGGHRPLTLVFATGRTDTAVREALFARRTVVYFQNLLIGRDEFLVPLIRESIVLKSARYPQRNDVLELEIDNRTGADFILRNMTGFTFHNTHDVVTLRPGINRLQVKTVQRLKSISLRFEVLSAVNAPRRHPEVEWSVKVD